MRAMIKIMAVMLKATQPMIEHTPHAIQLYYIDQSVKPMIDQCLDPESLSQSPCRCTNFPEFSPVESVNHLSEGNH